MSTKRSKADSYSRDPAGRARAGGGHSTARNLNARTPAHRGFNYRHREIMRALMREDGPAAAKAIEEHILMAKEQTQRDFQHQQMDQAREKSLRVHRRLQGSTA